MNIHVVANNSKLFPCIEIMDVFNFRADARIGNIFTRKFFAQKFGTRKFSDLRYIRFATTIASWQLMYTYYELLSNFVRSVL